ncbi:MAG: nitrilase-related carbon-nitrogen hydrolase [Planctomycetota bacterium]
MSPTTPRLRSRLARALLVAASAVLYVSAFPLTSFWPLIFVALVPALWATAGLTARQAFGHGVGLGFLIGALGLTWFWSLLGPLTLALWLILGLWFGLFFWGRALLHRRLPLLPAVAGTILWWTAVEFFRAECYPLRASFLCLGHALAAEGCAYRLAAGAVGAYGLGTLAIAANVGFAGLCRTARRGPPAARFFGVLAVSAFLILQGLVAQQMWARSAPSEDPGDAEYLAACAVQHEPGALGSLLKLSRSARGARPRWIFWPELSVSGDVLARPWLRKPIARLARDTGAVVGVGCRLDYPDDRDKFWNGYVLFAPDGRPIGTYKKVQPVPFTNDGVPGSDYPVFEANGAALGVAICYDGDFSWVSRRLVANGAELLVIPTLDPLHWGDRMREQHLAAAVLRAVENDRWVVRPANTAPTVIIDSWGHIAARRDERGPGLLIAWVRPRQSRPFYTRGGWLWPYVCQGLSVCLLAWALLARRGRKGAASDPPRGRPG